MRNRHSASVRSRSTHCGVLCAELRSGTPHKCGVTLHYSAQCGGATFKETNGIIVFSVACHAINSHSQPNRFASTTVTTPPFRLKLLESGGVDVGNYDPDCAHVIVDKLIYVITEFYFNCILDGKTLVTGLWIDHSFDVRMPVDSTSVLRSSIGVI
ncbi:unnamed protein product [Fraxinus pennsylvanica]|uniref:Uncharacterized protein n=1 Tax=Fraxinus pennsylvanica TaxID=56036 RepID=A0AAD1ZA22_9LAMI|nr:unnamed protein product [Fraxinus pennsylvanica]